MDDRKRMLDAVRTTARWNGGSIFVVAALSALFATGWGAAFALAVAAGGLGELLAGRHAPAEPARARRGLVASQLWIMALIGGYSLWRLATLDAARLLVELGPDVAAMLGGPADDPLLGEVLVQAFRLVYGTLLFVTAVYQGGMAWHYHRKIGRALAAPPAA